MLIFSAFQKLQMGDKRCYKSVTPQSVTQIGAFRPASTPYNRYLLHFFLKCNSKCNSKCNVTECAKTSAFIGVLAVAPLHVTELHFFFGFYEMG